MKTLEILCRQLSMGEFEFSRHAFKRAVERNISEIEIRAAGAHARIIEDYPDDKYGPSCLIMGITENGRILHIQTNYPPIVKVITVYEPSPDEWEADSKTRK